MRWCLVKVSILVCFSLLIVVGLPGCTTKAKARIQARQAYIAGQEQALARMQQAREPTVTVMGQVRNSILPWAEDLTLAKALIAAEYLGRGDPASVLVIRNGIAKEIDPRILLRGDDIPLVVGDIVQIR